MLIIGSGPYIISGNDNLYAKSYVLNINGKWRNEGRLLTGGGVRTDTGVVKEEEWPL